MKLIERAQHKFTRQLFVRTKLLMISYTEHYAYLNTDLLKLRHIDLYTDLLNINKIIGEFCFTSLRDHCFNLL